MKYYNSFSCFLKKYFKEPVHKISVNAGFTCPNKDSTISSLGCIYCNNESFSSGGIINSKLSVKDQIKGRIKFIERRYGVKKFIVYFQPFTNTYGSIEKLEKIYKEALVLPQVAGISIGTRPDCINEEKIKLLSNLSGKYFVCLEYGLQSVYDKSLKFINRGHTYQDFLNALKITKNQGIFIGLHLILGIPGETKNEMLKEAKEISSLPVNFLKLHHLEIIKNTPLAEIYKKSPFPVWGYEDYLNFLIEFIENLNPDIVIQRLFSETSSKKLLIAPLWGKGKHQILNDICKKFEEKKSFQGRRL